MSTSGVQRGGFDGCPAGPYMVIARMPDFGARQNTCTKKEYFLGRGHPVVLKYRHINLYVQTKQHMMLIVTSYVVLDCTYRFIFVKKRMLYGRVDCLEGKNVWLTAYKNEIKAEF